MAVDAEKFSNVDHGLTSTVWDDHQQNDDDDDDDERTEDQVKATGLRWIQAASNQGMFESLG